MPTDVTALKQDLTRRMEGAMETLKKEFSGLRTGRASPALLEPVRVEAYGSVTPLNQVANISVAGPGLLAVQVWDKGMTKAVHKLAMESRIRCFMVVSLEGGEGAFTAQGKKNVSAKLGGCHRH